MPLFSENNLCVCKPMRASLIGGYLYSLSHYWPRVIDHLVPVKIFEEIFLFTGLAAVLS